MTAPTGSEQIECQTIRYTSSPRGTGCLALVAFITAMMGFVGAMTMLTGGGALAVIGGLPFLATIARLWWRHRAERLGDGHVWFDDGILYAQSAERHVKIASDEIAWGANRGATVEYGTKTGRRLTFVTPSPADAKALLESSGNSVDQRVMTLPLRAVIGPFVTGLLWFFAFLAPVGFLSTAAANWMGGGIAMTLGILGTPLLSFLLARQWVKLAATPTVSVGIDGVTVKRGLRPRFIPHEDIQAVEYALGTNQGQERLVLQLRDEALSLPIVTWSKDDFERVSLRIDQARATALGKEVSPAAAFARKGLDVGAWQQRLRRQLSADPSFRQRRVTVEDAQGVLSDPAESIDHRVGAALALREVDPDNASTRIRFAADASAEERVRVVLMSTLEDEKAAQAALDAFEEQEAAQQKRKIRLELDP